MVRNPRFSASTAGFSLIELMIAGFLGLLVTYGIIQVFQATRNTFHTQEALARIQENYRIAMARIWFDQRFSGALGCGSGVAPQPLVHLLNFGEPNVGWNYNYFRRIEGFEFRNTAPAGDLLAAGAGTFLIDNANPAPSGDASLWNPPLPPDLVGLVLPGSDVFVSRYTEEPPAWLNAGTGAAAQVRWDPANQQYCGDIHLATAPANFVQSGAMYLVGSCDPTSVIVAQGIDNGGGRLCFPVAGLPPPANSLTHPITGLQWETSAMTGVNSLAPEFRRLHTSIYYVGIGASGEPALFRRNSQVVGGRPTMVSEELVDGVENMQVSYLVKFGAPTGAVDASGLPLFDYRDQNAGGYTTAGSIGTLAAGPWPAGLAADPNGIAQAGVAGDPDVSQRWNNVAAVRIGLLMRSADRVPVEQLTNVYTVDGVQVTVTTNDGRFRVAQSVSVNSRNGDPNIYPR